MRYLLTALAALSILIPSVNRVHASQDLEPTAFHISSFGTGFAMQGKFEGQYRVYPDTIEVTVSRASIRISDHCPYKGRRMLASVRFGIATCIDEKRWKTVSKSKEFPVERVMSPGDEFDLDVIQFSIPKEEATDLTKHWFVVELEDVVLDLPERERKPGYAYAHSRRDIFSQQ